MEKIFQDLLNVAGVHGLILLSRDGSILFESLDYSRALSKKSNISWEKILNDLENFKEMDLVYEHGRLYIRKTATGFLVLNMTANVSIAMVKLNCDIAVSRLKDIKPEKKGLGRFFNF